MAKKAQTIKAHILDIKGNSLDDGPGIRTVLFFKGCPLSCLWCHNPESKLRTAELSFDAATCVGCHTCIAACPDGALAEDTPFFIQRHLCTLCWQCIQACPSGALTKVGTEMSTAEMMAVIQPDIPFFNTSGGGVTLSGGEPTLQMRAVSELLKALKKENIHTLLETCGYFDLKAFMRLVYPFLDEIYYDIKIFDSQLHKKYCGVSNKNILKNFTRLLETTRNDGKGFLPRVPLIPGYTDTEDNLEGIAGFLKARSIEKAALLAYNPLWHEKCDKIGSNNPYHQNQAMTRFMDKETIKHCEDIFHHKGIAV